MKKAAAVIAAVLIAGTVCSCSGKSNKKGSASGSEDRPVTWSVQQRQLENVTPRDGEEQVFVKRDEEDEDKIYLIQGILSEDPVNDEKQALDLIASYSEVMGFNDVYSDLKFKDTVEYDKNIEYRFEQYCGDLKAGFVNLTVDTSIGSKAVVINSGYADTWGFSTKPKVSSKEAVKCAAAKYNVDKDSEPELTICSGPVLAWKVPVDKNGVYVYINAENGDIM